MRVGVSGSIVDNAHAGGVFSQINTESWCLESNGIDVCGHEYEEHPDTHKRFKGFQIPRWDDCKALVGIAMQKYPKVIVCGWDLCINDKGEIEIIEGNHAPDVDVMQSPLKVGKRKYYQAVLENFGIKL